MADPPSQSGLWLRPYKMLFPLCPPSALPNMSAFRSVTLAVLAMLSITSATYVPFTTCTPHTDGIVHSVDISPCERGSNSEPCRFRYNHNYTITIQYESMLDSGNQAESSLEARDDSVYPSLFYPYSGQSFSACEYTACPIKARNNATYTYNFQTLKSKFDHLLVNVTTSMEGPSVLCAGFEASYLPAVTGRNTTCI